MAELNESKKPAGDETILARMAEWRTTLADIESGHISADQVGHLRRAYSESHRRIRDEDDHLETATCNAIAGHSRWLQDLILRAAITIGMPVKDLFDENRQSRSIAWSEFIARAKLLAKTAPQTKETWPRDEFAREAIIRLREQPALRENVSGFCHAFADEKELPLSAAKALRTTLYRQTYKALWQNHE